MGTSNVWDQDLIPLLVQHTDNDELFQVKEFLLEFCLNGIYRHFKLSKGLDRISMETYSRYVYLT